MSLFFLQSMSTRPAKLNIIFEDNHLLVVDKPPQLPTMGARPGEDSLYHQARQYIKHEYNKPGNVYLGIVSRLDSFVTGVIVLAKTSKAASRLSDQIRRGVVEKRYWAIVPNALPNESGLLEDRIVKDDTRHRMVVVPGNSVKLPDERNARLRYRTLSQFKSLCLIEVELETGRKHQIRVQLENMGCSIIGDQKYGSVVSFPKGIALHSRRLTLEHPTKRVIQSFESTPPDWWNLDRFRL